MRRKEKSNKLTVEEVKRIKWKKLSKGRDSLTDYEKKVLEKYDYDGEKIIKAVKFERMTDAENLERKKRGLPPRVFRKNEMCP
jgi:hypothetical protein